MTVLNDIYPCRAKWYNLGIQLRVVVGTLDCFKVQYGDPGDQLREVLRMWLTSSDNPTWMALTEALKSPVIEETKLARELQKKYCSSRQRPVDGEWIHVTLQLQFGYHRDSYWMIIIIVYNIQVLIQTSSLGFKAHSMFKCYCIENSLMHSHTNQTELNIKSCHTPSYTLQSQEIIVKGGKLVHHNIFLMEKNALTRDTS